MMVLRRFGSSAVPLTMLSESCYSHGSCRQLSILGRMISAQWGFSSHVACESHMNKLECDNINSCINYHSRRFLHTSSLKWAGHSKWANIKHIKEANDKLKGQKATQLSRQIQSILSRNPETNPKLNFELANVIKSARSNNIPNEVIERAIDRVSKLRDPSSLTVFDGRGMSNTAILIECLSVNPTHTKQILQGTVKKYGFNLHSSALDLFDHKGIVEAELAESELAVVKSDQDKFCMDKYVDIAIEVGAEDVTLETGSDVPYLQFLCGPQDVETVQSGLDAQGLNVTSAERTYIPTMVIPVSKDYMESLDKLITKLDMNTDVVKYHFNVELEGSS